MTKPTLVVALLAVVAATLSAAALLPLLVPQTLVALTLCLTLFNVIGGGERRPR